MIDVDRLNNTITELEAQSEKMKTASEYYKQLMEISVEVAATSNSQKDINESIESTIKELVNLKEENRGIIEGFENSSKKITKDIEKLEDEILKNVQALSSDNNKLYSDFQQFLNSKLELFKSDVQLEIRGTADRLQSSLEKNLKKIEEQANSNLNENKLALDKIESNIMSSFEMQNKKMKVNMIIVVAIFIVSAVSLIVNLL